MNRSSPTIPEGSNRNQRAQCRECGTFVRSDNLKRHLNTHKTQYQDCTQCSKSICVKTMVRHLKTHLPLVPCANCTRPIREDKMPAHLILCNDGVDERLCNRHSVDHLPECSASSIDGFFRRWDLHVAPSSDYDTMLTTVAEAAKDILQNILLANPVKSQFTISVGFTHDELDGSTSFTEAFFRTRMEPVLIGDNLDSYLARVAALLRLQIEDFERLGSGWSYDNLISARLEAARYVPLTAGAYIEIPNSIKDMKSTLNINSPDNKCILWCLLAKKCLDDDKAAEDLAKSQGKTPAEINDLPKKMPPKGKRRHTASSYIKFENEMNMEGIEYPIKLKDIGKVEKMNNLSITIIEWDFEENCAVPLRRGCGQGVPVELLYLENETNSHYVLIKDFNQFMRHRTKYSHKKYHCLQCLYGYLTADKLKEHMLSCEQRLYQVPRLPEKGKNCLKFQNDYKAIRKLFTIYSDSETVLKVEDDEVSEESSSFTVPKQTHIPCSFSIVTSSKLSDYIQVNEVITDSDPKRLTKTYMCRLEEIHADMMLCYERNKFKIDMTEEDKKAFKESTHCHICKKGLDWNSVKNYPVKDHDHFLEKKNYRGSAHNSCNLRYWERTKKVPVMFHNLAYDLNNFLLDLLKLADNPDDISIIPQNLEKFKAVYTDHFIFMDTLQFLPASLADLVDNLKSQGTDNFKRLRAYYPDNYELLTEKGVFPYDLVTDFEVFSRTSLPSQDCFYNKLNEEGITDKDYARAQKTWDDLNCSTFLDYMETYVLTDALLLCDVFENFRNLCERYYKLDPCHYLSLPAFGMDAMLKMTGVELELFTDMDMYLFMEQSLRGGITTTNHRHAKANNPYLLDYDESKETSYIQYLDVNNL